MLSNTNARPKSAWTAILSVNARHPNMGGPSKGIAGRKSWIGCEAMRNHSQLSETSVPGSISWSARLPARRDTASSERGGEDFGESVFRNTSYPPYKTS